MSSTNSSCLSKSDSYKSNLEACKFWNLKLHTITNPTS